MTKRFGVLVGVLIIFMAVDTVGQQIEGETQRSARIKATQPTVFLELVRIGKSDTDDSDSVAHRAWFRLINNSKWLIKIDASGSAEHPHGTRLYYDTLDLKGNLIERYSCRVCSIIGIAAGKSIVFSVPHDELLAASSVRVQFAYEWEDRVSVAPSFEPSHFVYFYTSNLKPSL